MHADQSFREHIFFWFKQTIAFVTFSQQTMRIFANIGAKFDTALFSRSILSQDDLFQKKYLCRNNLFLNIREHPSKFGVCTFFAGNPKQMYVCVLNTLT